MTSTDIRVGLAAAAIVLLAGITSVVVHAEGGPLDEPDAVRCVERIGDRLGYEVTQASAQRGADHVWDVTGIAQDGILRISVRAPDGHVLDAALIPIGGTATNAITRQQRLAAFEVDCGP